MRICSPESGDYPYMYVYTHICNVLFKYTMYTYAYITVVDESTES